MSDAHETAILPSRCPTRSEINRVCTATDDYKLKLSDLESGENNTIYVAKIKSLISCAFLSASYVVEETRKHLEDHRSWKDYHCPATCQL